jgi:hypothetical protein
VRPTTLLKCRQAAKGGVLTSGGVSRSVLRC